MKFTSKHACLGLAEIDRTIVEALRYALEELFPEMMQTYHITERNGYGKYKWNFIIAQLRTVCSHLGWIDNGLCQRAAWKLPVLFYEETRVLITFMTEDTFVKIQKRSDKGKHYLCGAAAFNRDVEALYEQLELQLSEIPPAEEKWIAASQEQLTKAVNRDVGEVAGHVLILFDVHADRLLSVRAVRLTPTLEISTEQEDWSALIRPPYDTEQVVTPQSNDIDENELLVSLK